ncbi:hypothetical protein [Streptosporangium roseum]|uniref:hypothetical protein n=1 Tax=Streptosporangium roseum TaxID=2001 RepID=UPI0004CDA48F|nr:hypothetical protein [Streptosporangium roseum]
MSKSRAGHSAARTPLSLAASIALLLTLGAPAASASSTPAATASRATASRAAAMATVAWRADPLEITVPASASLGSGVVGSTISASLGTVTVVDSRAGIPPWTATVSATDFTTGGGSPAQTIAKANVGYWSGPSTASSGGGSRTAGQNTAAQVVSLSAPAIAFRGRKQAGIPSSTSWEPTLVVTIPSLAAAGLYTGVITHSVA